MNYGLFTHGFNGTKTLRISSHFILWMFFTLLLTLYLYRYRDWDQWLTESFLYLMRFPFNTLELFECENFDVELFLVPVQSQSR